MDIFWKILKANKRKAEAIAKPKKEKATALLAVVSGSADDFERDLFKLINAYTDKGMKKPALVKKMEWATGNCKFS